MSAISRMTRGMIASNRSVSRLTIGYIDFFIGILDFVPTFLTSPSYTLRPGFFRPMEFDPSRVIFAIPDAPRTISIVDEVDLVSVKKPRRS